jgi:oligoendopeptidase F
MTKTATITRTWSRDVAIALTIGIAALGSARAGSARAQTPAADAPRLSRTLYFADSSKEFASRAGLHGRVDSLVHVIADADVMSLHGDLKESDELLVALQRHAAYLRVRSLENSDDQRAKAAYSSVTTDQSVLRSAVILRLERVPPDQIGSLGKFALLAREVQSTVGHNLHPEAERYRDAVTIATEQAIADAYDAQIASLPPVRNLEVPDLAARRTALARRDAIYDSAAPVTATLLATLIDLENRDAAAHGFTNAAAWKYLSLGLSDTLVDRTLAIVRAEAPAYREYERVLASHASKRLGVSPVLAAEQHIGVSAAAAVPFNEGRRLILESVAPLGPDYVRRFDALLDPANGRLDLGGGSHRVNIGTSIVAYDAPVAFYNGEYTGTLDNLGVIAHEGGHAIHRELMNLDSLPVYERSGSHFLFEGYAIFNQWLLFDHAARTADTPAGREQALEALLSSMGVEIFTSAEETTFERALYATASGQALLPRDKLDEVYRTSISPFEYWPVADVGRSRAWMTKSLLFEDPLYLVNYLYASFIAAALYDRAQVDPDFSRKYEALLRRGFDADPKTLLATIGIQLDDPSVIRGAIALFKAKTRELQSLYGVK